MTRNTVMKGEWSARLALMIYLVVSVTLLSVPAASAQDAFVRVDEGTGNPSVTIPLMNIPGIRGLDHDIMLQYIATDGVPVSMMSSEVGLGWALNHPSITRTTMGIPDDLDASETTANLYWSYKNEDVDNLKKTPWWKVAIFMVITIAVVVGTILLSTVSLGTLTGPALALAQAVIVAAAGIVGSVILDQLSSALGEGIVFKASLTPDPITLAGSFAGSVSSAAAAVQTVLGTIATVNALQSSAAYVLGYDDILTSRPLTTNYNEKYSVSGLFYDQRYYFNAILPKYDAINRDVQVNINNYDITPETDFGQPDIYTVSSPGYSGKLIAGSAEDLSLGFAVTDIPNIPISGSLQFYPELTATETAPNVRAISNLLKMEEAGQATADCLLAFSESFCEADANVYVESYIDQFIVESKDGFKLIFGHPSVQGSIIREHRSGRSTYTFVEDDVASTRFDGRQTYLQATHHPIEWKIVAILGPDYRGPTYPLLDEDNAEGSWIAFKYDSVFDMQDPSTQCGFMYGNNVPSTDLWEYYGDHLQGTESQIISGSQGEAVSRTSLASIQDVSYVSEIITPSHQAIFTYTDKVDEPNAKPWFDLNSAHSWFGNVESERELGYTDNSANLRWYFEDGQSHPSFRELWVDIDFAAEDQCSAFISDYTGYKQKVDQIQLEKRVPTTSVSACIETTNCAELVRQSECNSESVCSWTIGSEELDTSFCDFDDPGCTDRPGGFCVGIPDYRSGAYCGALSGSSCSSDSHCDWQLQSVVTGEAVSRVEFDGSYSLKQGYSTLTNSGLWTLEQVTPVSYISGRQQQAPYQFTYYEREGSWS